MGFRSPAMHGLASRVAAVHVSCRSPPSQLQSHLRVRSGSFNAVRIDPPEDTGSTADLVGSLKRTAADDLG